MTDWQITVPPHITIPARAARALLNDRGGVAALLYIHMQLNGGRLDVKAAADELALTPEQLQRALDALKRLDLADQAGAAIRALQNDKRPDYSPAELTASLNGDKHFKQLSEDVSRKLGKILSNADMMTLLGLYNWLGLSADVISLLVVHCIDEQTRKYGAGKPPTLRSIEKTAVEWEKKGLVTAELAETWLTEREKALQSAAQIAKVLQIKGRALSSSEEAYINQWAAMGFTPELVYLAYDRTVIRCGRLEWKYLDTILRSWYDKGLLTQDAVESSDVKPARAPAASVGKGKPSGTAGDFERQAMLDNIKKFRKEK